MSEEALTSEQQFGKINFKMKLRGVVLPGRDPASRWDVEVKNKRIESITPAQRRCLGDEQEECLSSPSILIPALCHPHMHLDKPYLLTCNNQSDSLPSYNDLIPTTGSFTEALTNTSRAKTRYTAADLLLRGSQLLAASLTYGTTSLRAFVEVDHTTRHQCLDAAVQLKRRFAHACHVQICVFAQDPIFSSGHGEENRALLCEALDRGTGEIEALGTTPYVERDYETSLRNVQWAIATALERDLHLDFHLDYHVDPDRKAMVWDVVRLLIEMKWSERTRRTVVLGHCTRMTLFTDGEMHELGGLIRENSLKLSFVGLPTSDLFMMGRPELRAGPDENDIGSGQRQRGTLQVLDMIRRFGLDACMGVNNVGNAFTPWGTGDPLQLACLGVGIYQAGTEQDAKLLLECVSTRARRAIGLGDRDGEDSNIDTCIKEGSTADIMIVRNEELVGCPGRLRVRVPARQRLSVKDIAWDPPDRGLRLLIGLM